jgi:hypothetical protein
MKERTPLILMSLLALAIVAPGAAVAKPGGADRPWKGKGSGTTTFNVATTPFPGSTDGSARLSHLGRTSYSSNFAVTLSGGFLSTFTITGTQTLVAANGDMLFLSFTGAGTFTGVFGPGQTSETMLIYTVTGGTGRFDDATGTLSGTVSTNVASVSGATATGSHTFTAEGRISY